MGGIFRAYDIRGVYGEEIDAKTFLEIGQAFGSELDEEEVVVGSDVRISSPALKQAFIAGILSTGHDCTDIGVVSSPVLYFASTFYGDKAGAIITASHNPPQYNGVKFCRNGIAYSYESGINMIEQRVRGRDYSLKQWPEMGSLSYKTVLSDYTKYLLERIHLRKKMKVVIDVGNGATGFSEEIFRQAGCDVRMLFKDPDGRFPNHIPDPVREDTLSSLRKAVVEKGADLGIAFDGDGDRAGFVDDQGRIVKADNVLILLSLDILKRRGTSKIVATPLSSRALFETVSEQGGEIVLSKVGHSYVQEKLLESGALAAGELSGHFYLAENYYGFDDAMYAGLKLTELLSSSGRSFSELVDDLPSYFSSSEIRIPCPDDKKFQIVADLKKHFENMCYRVNNVDGVRIELDEGWGIVRASNTEPVLVLRFEAANEEKYNEIKSIIERQVETRIGGYQTD